MHFLCRQVSTVKSLPTFLSMVTFYDNGVRWRPAPEAGRLFTIPEYLDGPLRLIILSVTSGGLSTACFSLLF